MGITISKSIGWVEGQGVAVTGTGPGISVAGGGGGGPSCEWDTRVVTVVPAGSIAVATAVPPPVGASAVVSWPGFDSACGAAPVGWTFAAIAGGNVPIYVKNGDPISTAAVGDVLASADVAAGPQGTRIDGTVFNLSTGNYNSGIVDEVPPGSGTPAHIDMTPKGAPAVSGDAVGLIVNTSGAGTPPYANIAIMVVFVS